MESGFPIGDNSPRVLLWDIETMKMLLEMETYSLKQYSKYLNYKDIKRPVSIFCAAWQWYGQPFILSTSVLKDTLRFEQCFWDDYYVVKTLHDVLSQADIIIAHNGDNFDWKMFTARSLYHGLPPVKKPLMIDTLKIARKEFKIESNALGYLCKFLGVENKMESPDWGKIAKGDAEEIERAERYCRGDIRSLRGVYEKLRPFTTNHANLNAIHGQGGNCPKCGHWDLEKRGFNYTKAGKYQAYQCKMKTGGCGGWSQDKKNLKKVDVR